jgi:rsbT co-antagonist protein RsbR
MIARFVNTAVGWLWAKRRAGAVGVILGSALLWVASLPHPFTRVMSCYRKGAWGIPLLATMITGDAWIFIAYVWIPVLVVLLWWKLGRLRVLLEALIGSGVFVFACGTDHLTDIITTFYPIYWFAAEKRLVTGFISLSYAAALQSRWLPRIYQFVIDAREDKETLRRMAEQAAHRADELIKQRATIDAALAAQQDALTQLQATLGELQVAKAKAEQSQQEAEHAQAAAELLNTELQEARDREASRASRAVEGERRAVTELQELQEANRTIAQQSLTISQLSTPIIDVWEGVLALPVVGIVDSRRTSQMTERLLNKIVTDQARCVLVDMTGVDLVDTMVANHIVRLAKAITLLGTECIVTGLRPDVAQTLATAEFDVAQLRTERSLRAGLQTHLKTRTPTRKTVSIVR